MISCRSTRQGCPVSSRGPHPSPRIIAGREADRGGPGDREPCCAAPRREDDHAPWCPQCAARRYGHAVLVTPGLAGPVPRLRCCGPRVAQGPLNRRGQAMLARTGETGARSHHPEALTRPTRGQYLRRGLPASPPPWCAPHTPGRRRHARQDGHWPPAWPARCPQGYSRHSWP